MGKYNQERVKEYYLETVIKQLAEIYEKAADLMVDMNYSKRAADLYKKSYRLAQQQDNQEVLARLRNKLVEVA